MTEMQWLKLFALILIPLWVIAQPAGTCPCDLAQPETLKNRQCALCVEAEKQPADVPYFFLNDVNPRKANRLLLLPRQYTGGMMELKHISAKERTALWTAAINKSKELWGDDWGVATNGSAVRTQCHMHFHIGKMIKGLENTGKIIIVDSPSQIPVPKDGTGIWIHPRGKTLVVHLGEQQAETVLLR